MTTPNDLTDEPIGHHPPRRLQRRRTSSWRTPPGAVYVGRPSKWGNPFVVGETIGCDDQETAVALHEVWLAYGATVLYPQPGESERLAALREQVLADLHELRGRDLLCWCPAGQPCHANALLEAANRAEEQR